MEKTKPCLITQKIEEDPSPYPLLRYIHFCVLTMDDVFDDRYAYNSRCVYYFYMNYTKPITIRFFKGEPATHYESHTDYYDITKDMLYIFLILKKRLLPEIFLKILDTMLYIHFLYKKNKYEYI